METLVDFQKMTDKASSPELYTLRDSGVEDRLKLKYVG